jgi:hypothetical protein
VCCVPRFNAMSIAMRKLLTFLIALALTVGAIAGALAFGGGNSLRLGH